MLFAMGLLFGAISFVAMLVAQKELIALIIGASAFMLMIVSIYTETQSVDDEILTEMLKDAA